MNTQTYIHTKNFIHIDYYYCQHSACLIFDSELRMQPQFIPHNHMESISTWVVKQNDLYYMYKMNATTSELGNIFYCTCY